jgi:gliding motility-associated-like protein
MLRQLYLLMLCVVCCCFFSFASDENPIIKFTENKGQWDANVLFRAQLDGGALFLEKNCFTYSFYEKEKLRKNHVHSSDSPPTKEELEIKSHAFRVTMKNALMPQSVLPQKKSTNYSNFYIGNNSKRWTSHAYDYETVYYKEIYSGIDLEVNGKENSLKYNFIVHPGADASKICLSYFGIKNITNENGSLKIETPLTTIIESKPYAYQEINGIRVTVPCHFVLKDNEVTFSLPENYRADIPLVIDPTLIFCSYSGSTADNFGMTATYDNQGNFYAGGTAFAQGYPTTITAFDTTYNGIVQAGRTDVVITKYNSTGSSLIYSTYLGGAFGTEIVSSLIVNQNNELMLLGATGSRDFPVTPTAFDTTFAGGDSIDYPFNGTRYGSGTDIYLAKFSADGSQLLASTFVGGSKNDGVNSSASLVFNYGDYYRGEIQTDATGNFYIASCTYSLDFPTTPTAFQPAPGGQLDGCVFKMSPDLSTMLWSSYLGGSNDDCAYSLIHDDSLNIYVDGGTASTNFPVTAGVIAGTYRGGIADAFVTKIKPDGTSILRSTFIGTNLYDQSYFIQRDTLGSIYIFGQSAGNFPVSPGVYSNPNSHQFVARLTHELDTIQLSTVFGNGSAQVNLSPSAFLVDRCGNIYCSGWGGRIIPPTNVMLNMPVTPDAIQSTTDGHNFYFIVFSPFFQSLTYGSYFGGGTSWEHVDGGTSRFDRDGIIYQSVCAGCQTNASPVPHSDLPTTPGAWSNTNNSNNCNNGTIKLDFNITNTRAFFTATPKFACPYANVSFTNNSVSAISYEWNFGDGSPTNSQFSPSHVYDSSGTFVVRLIAISPFCGIDTIYDTINIYTPPIAGFTNSGVYCEGNTIQFNNGSTNPAAYKWFFGDNDSSAAVNPSHIYSPSGNYTVTLIVVDSLGCTDTTHQNININSLPVASISYTIDTCDLTALLFGNPANASAYFWDFGDADSDTVQNTTHTYDTSGTYMVTLIVTDSAGCMDTTTQTIAPYSFAQADFVYDIDTCSFMVQFTNQSINAIFNEWHFGDNGTSASVHPAHSFPHAGNFTVTLIVNPGTGCVDTTSKNIYLDEHIFADYFIPNIFTPNSDSYNPRFTIKGLDFCDEFLLKIYNRWGEMVFESSNILDSWDGTYKGKDVPDGVYFYIIKGNRVNRGGTVTVKRK